jgi:hypothetical protein
MDLADEAYRNGEIGEARKAMVHGRDVVDHLIDVARLVVPAEEVCFRGKQVL